MSKTPIKTVQAKSLPTRVPIAYCGTADAPERPIHATAYKRGEGTVVIARADGKHLEVRPSDRVRYAADPVAVKATRLRWCKGGSSADRETYPNGTPCEGGHLRRIGTDKAASAYCDTMLAWYRANPLDAAGLAEVRETAHTNAIAARIGRTLNRQAPSADRMRASVLRARLEAYGTDSRQFTAMAKDYGMTVAEAIALVEQEYDVRVDTTA